MKNKNLFLKIYISLLIICVLTLFILSVLGKKTRIGYLGEFVFYINPTLELNGLSSIEENYVIEEKIDGKIERKLDEEALKNFIFTNESVTNYSYGFRVKYYDKVFRNSDIYDVYIDTNKILQSNSFIKEVKMNEDGSPFGTLITTKTINEDKIDNVDYLLKIKIKLIALILLILFILLNFKVKLIDFYSKYKCYINKLLLITAISVILLVVLISFLGKIDRKAYLSEFYLKSSNGTEYTYSFKIKYYSNIFTDNNIYSVYPYLDNMPEYVKLAEMNNIFGTPFGTLISDKELKYDDKIDNIKYYLMVKFDLFYYLGIIFILIILFFAYYLLNEYWKYKNTLNQYDYIFIGKLELISILIFVFKCLLLYPGSYSDWDTINSVLNALFAISTNNWHPILMELSIKFMDHLGLDLGVFFIINTFLLHLSFFIIITSLYLKYKNKFVILLFLILFISQIFFMSIEYLKDPVASIYVIFSYSIVFCIIILSIKDTNIKNILKAISFIFLILGMLHRHNFIVTVYPIFIWFTYDFLRDKKITNIKKYLISFSALMMVNAIILMGIYFIFPRIFVKQFDNSTAHLFFLQIAGCIVPANDSSLIPGEWYYDGKSFEDMRNLYIDNPTFADQFLSVIKNRDSEEIKRIWIKSILKHPVNYIKHIYNFTKSICILNYEVGNLTWANYTELYDYLLERYVYKKHPNLKIDEEKKESFYNENQGVKFNKLKYDIYIYLTKHLPNINILIFILLSIILFFVTGLLWVLKKFFRMDILLFAFSTSFSAFATVIIVCLFSPIAIYYRYIYPVIPISLISLISFVIFICDMGIKNFVIELRGK